MGPNLGMETALPAGCKDNPDAGMIRPGDLLFNLRGKKNAN